MEWVEPEEWRWAVIIFPAFQFCTFPPRHKRVQAVLGGRLKKVWFPVPKSTQMGIPLHQVYGICLSNQYKRPRFAGACHSSLPSIDSFRSFSLLPPFHWSLVDWCTEEDLKSTVSHWLVLKTTPGEKILPFSAHTNPVPKWLPKIRCSAVAGPSRSFKLPLSTISGRKSCSSQPLLLVSGSLLRR